MIERIRYAKINAESAVVQHKHTILNIIVPIIATLGILFNVLIFVAERRMDRNSPYPGIPSIQILIGMYIVIISLLRCCGVGRKSFWITISCAAGLLILLMLHLINTRTL